MPVAGRLSVVIKGDPAVSPAEDPDNTSPTVDSITPADNATGVAVNTDIVATFSEAVDTSTVDETTFVVLDGLNSPVVGVVTPYGDGLGASFDPNANLTNDTTYTVILNSGIADLASNPMVPFTSTFNTEGPGGNALSGLISWWPGDLNADDIIAGNNGTLQGGAGFLPGLVGQAFSLDGAGDYVSIPHHPSLNLHDFTLEAWVKPQILPTSTWQAIIAKNQNPRPPSLYLYGDIVQVWFGHDVGPPTGDLKAAGTIPLTEGNWHHVAATYDGSAVKIYVDGTLDVSVATTVTPHTNTSELMLGQKGTNDSYFKGLIDEATIFNRALDAAEIQGIFDAGSAGKARP